MLLSQTIYKKVIEEAETKFYLYLMNVRLYQYLALTMNIANSYPKI